MADRLDGLRHHAVIGGHHQDHDVGNAGAAGAHGGESLVARRVDECDLFAGRHLHLIGADVLGDATGLAGRDVGRTQRIEQRGLAVVHVTHHGDHRRTRLQVVIGIGGTLQAHLDVGLRDTPCAVAEFLHHEFRGIGIQRLGDGGHDAEFHQRLDHLAGACGHAVGEFLHRDAVGQDDVAHHLHLVRAQPLQLGLAALALTLAPHRGQ